MDAADMWFGKKKGANTGDKKGRGIAAPPFPENAALT
jgi:hypothetical protein